MIRFAQLLGAAVVAVTAFAGAQAQANPIYLGATFPSDKGAITDLKTGNGSAGVSGYQHGTFTIDLTATGSPALVNPNFGSNTLAIKSNGAGTVILYATETNDTAIVPSFLLGLSNNPLSDVSVTEAVYSSTSNTKYALTTLLGSATLKPGETVSINAPFGSLQAPYSITQVYTITFGSTGGSVNATILEKANVAEPMSLSLLGAGLVGLGFVRLRRKADASAA